MNWKEEPLKPKQMNAYKVVSQFPGGIESEELMIAENVYQIADTYPEAVSIKLKYQNVIVLRSKT